MDIKIKHLAVLGCGLLAVGACSRLVWTTLIEKGESLGTVANFVLPASAGNLLVAGQLQTYFNEDAFFLTGKALVLQYDDGGNLLWRNELGEGDSLLGVTAIDTAADGSIYVSDMRISGNGVTRLDAAGNVVWEQVHPYADEYNWDGTTVTKVVNNNLIVLGREVSTSNGDGAGDYLLGLDADGNPLWRFDGMGVGQDDSIDKLDVEVLPGNRIATYTVAAPGDDGLPAGDLILIDSNGQELARKSQQLFGLTRILGIAVLGDQLVVAGTTATGSRLLLLEGDLATARQQDFGYASTARLSTAGGTLCFGLLDSVDLQPGEVGYGSVTLGILDSAGGEWSAVTNRILSVGASIYADANRCAFTDVAEPDADTLTAQISTLVFSAKGVQETVVQPGSRIPIFGSNTTVLQGRKLTNAVTDADPATEALILQGRLVRHLLY